MSIQNRPTSRLITESFTNKGARQASEMLKKIPSVIPHHLNPNNRANQLNPNNTNKIIPTQKH